MCRRFWQKQVLSNRPVLVAYCPLCCVPVERQEIEEASSPTAVSAAAAAVSEEVIATHSTETTRAVGEQEAPSIRGRTRVDDAAKELPSAAQDTVAVDNLPMSAETEASPVAGDMVGEVNVAAVVEAAETATVGE